MIEYKDTKKWDIVYQASTGDGAVFCFKEPKDPFLLSIALHRRLICYNENMSEDLEKIQIRIGISSGETMLVTHFDRSTNAPWGRDVLIAKRIMDVGKANQILVSKHVVDQVKQLDRTYKFVDMGRYTVKHGENVSIYSFLYQDEKNQIGNANPISS